jgi:hypothetical protein
MDTAYSYAASIGIAVMAADRGGTVKLLVPSNLKNPGNIPRLTEGSYLATELAIITHGSSKVTQIDVYFPFLINLDGGPPEKFVGWWVKGRDQPIGRPIEKTDFGKAPEDELTANNPIVSKPAERAGEQPMTTEGTLTGQEPTAGEKGGFICTMGICFEG